MTFYEAITGHHPFEDAFEEHPKELLKCHRHRIPAPPSTYLPASMTSEAAEAIDAVFAAACAKNPDERFGSARAMQHALTELDRFAPG
jgi:serine/threonine-protein kinase